ncbi:sporulation integral membrane protein YtvI [Aneurinibacillus sp. Ricciae_BoGa-3]|uniref:sporulation integral membrane protein YtvI n=1 Tax=Aneurinibacillus sp. Ricciae_BoGa-3 TaxID=3022697 RepID=UPI00234102A8|nr:sporulation integral membrane protein YtvI [Aneurinibacillus sp. Ricciae_BoGa-3]WCK55515.1 sporulation integral membrane protein YtvI [Aneurinibacillus sp. Ricciae_BoGa-3]
MDPTIYRRLFQVLRFLLAASVVVIGYKLILFVTPLLYPFIIGFIIAYIINGPVDMLENNRRWPRWLAVLVILAFVILMLAAVLTILVTQLVIETGNLIDTLPHYIDQLTKYSANFLEQGVNSSIYGKFAHLYSNLEDPYKQKIQENLSIGMTKIAMAGTALTTIILSGIRNFLSSVPDAATVMVISVLSAFFISKDYHRIKRKIREWVPLEHLRKGVMVVNNLQQALIGFIKAQLTIISITAVLVIIGLLIIGVPYAVSIGLLTGLADLMPYIGTGAVFIPWIIYAIFSGDYHLVIGLCILFATVIVLRQIIEPKIVANNVGLDPLLTLVALFAGLKLFGFLGLVMGPVLLVLFNALRKAGVFKDTWDYIKGPPPPAV